MSLRAKIECLDVPINHVQNVLILLIMVYVGGRRVYCEFGVSLPLAYNAIYDFQLWLQKHHKVPPNLNATSYPNLGLGLAGAGKSSIAPTSVVGPSDCQSVFCSYWSLN
jgi:hypothetical protein